MTPSALLVVAGLLAALPAPAGPVFQTAGPAGGPFTAYQVSVQVRPPTAGAVFVWPGGYLSDGLFVQDGLALSTGQVFSWATRDSYGPANDPAANPSPLRWWPGHARPGQWLTFGLVRSGADRWAFYYLDPAGRRHPLGAFADRAALASVGVTVETWGGASFGAVAVRGIRVRTPAGRWIVPPLAYGSSGPCVAVASATRGAVVWRDTPGPCWRVLWR